MVYLAGAIDLESNGHGPKEDLAKRVNELGYTVYCPWRAFSHVEGNGKYVRAANLRMVESSNALLAVVDPKVHSHGTVIDIEHAYQNGVPVYVILKDGVDPPMYLEHIPCFANEEDALAAMDKTLTRKVAFNRLLNNMREVAEYTRATTGPDIAKMPIEAEDEPPVISETHSDSQPIWCVAEDDHPEPSKTYSDDAGFDLYVRGRHFVLAGHWADIEVGTKLALPEGYWGLILGRSSAFYRLGLQMQPAVIDAGWRGELKVAVFNGTEDDITIEDKDRVAQFIPLPAPKFHIVPTMELPPGSRGERGFGSSGR